MTQPVLTVPFIPTAFLRRGSGSALVGLTASNGAVWQAVDVVSFAVSTLPYTDSPPPPPVPPPRGRDYIPVG